MIQFNEQNDNQDNQDKNIDEQHKQEQEEEDDEEEEEEVTMLSIPVVHEILDYIHPELKNIVHKEGNTLFDNEDYRLPLSLIMSSSLEDYFEPVLLSDRFKGILCDECAKRGELSSLMWARLKGCPWTIPISILEIGRQAVSSSFGFAVMSTIFESNLQHIGELDPDYESQIQTGACYLAAQAGHLHILEWARNNGCEWDEDTCKAAAHAGHWDIAKWCIDNGCPCSSSLRTEIENKTS